MFVLNCSSSDINYVNSGPCGSEVVKSHGRSLEVFDLPSIGDFVMLIVTAVATPQRFYAQLPLGPNTLSITEDSGMFNVTPSKN